VSQNPTFRADQAPIPNVEDALTTCLVLQSEKKQEFGQIVQLLLPRLYVLKFDQIVLAAEFLNSEQFLTLHKRADRVLATEFKVASKRPILSAAARSKVDSYPKVAFLLAQVPGYCQRVVSQSLQQAKKEDSLEESMNAAASSGNKAALSLLLNVAVRSSNRRLVNENGPFEAAIKNDQIECAKEVRMKGHLEDQIYCRLLLHLHKNAKFSTAAYLVSLIPADTIKNEFVLYEAIKSEIYVSAVALLKSNKARPVSFETIRLAARSKDPTFIQLLCEAEKDIDKGMEARLSLIDITLQEGNRATFLALWELGFGNPATTFKKAMEIPEFQDLAARMAKRLDFDDKEAFDYAIKKGLFNVIPRLVTVLGKKTSLRTLRHLNPNEMVSSLFKDKKDLEMLRVLQESTGLLDDRKGLLETLLAWSIGEGNYEAGATFLLSSTQVNPTKKFNRALKEAFQLRRYEVLRLLMDNPDVKKAAKRFKLLSQAQASGDERLIEVLSVGEV
jgi:hypothetical protein